MSFNSTPSAAGLIHICIPCLRALHRRPLGPSSRPSRILSSGRSRRARIIPTLPTIQPNLHRPTPLSAPLRDIRNPPLRGISTRCEIPDTILAYYWDTDPPTADDLASSDKFFRARRPQLQWSATHFRTIPSSDAPEVAFLGRSNVGKSTLLNTLLGSRICNTSSKPGRTRTMNAFDVADGRLTVLDMPGYGRASQDEWGPEIIKYLTGRRQLRRAFLLIDSMHGVKPRDADLLDLLRRAGVPHQVVLSKVDRLLFPTMRSRRKELQPEAVDRLNALMRAVRDVVQPADWRGPAALGELIACAAERRLPPMTPAQQREIVASTPKHLVKRWNERDIGISAVRYAVLAAIGHPSPPASVVRA
ncbi:MAG: hypothetical protein M1825_001073 [Sarcosagium campestre]|nr:MAG: hypothetical protein M1825_001073 [Sarcosagium campestre]